LRRFCVALMISASFFMSLSKEVMVHVGNNARRSIPRHNGAMRCAYCALRVTEII
jgi:hypothetical protein